jgi:hypothetical protein
LKSHSFSSIINQQSKIINLLFFNRQSEITNHQSEKGVFPMGYVNDKHMSQFISPALWLFAGTSVNTNAVASNLVKVTRGQSTTAFSIWIPIPLPSNDSALKGCRLKSIDFFYKNATADLTSFTEPVLQKVTLGADTVAPTAAQVTTTSTPTNANTLTQAEHKVTVTLTTPEWMDDDAAYYLDIECDPAATSDLTFYGARANYDVRL